MARYRASISSPLAPAEAFACMADVTRFVEWDPSVRKAQRVKGAGPGLGTIYELTVVAGGTTEMRYEVTAYDSPKRMVLIARTATLTSVDEVRVEPDGAGSVVTYDALLTLKGPLAVFDLFLGMAFKRLGDRAASGLRRFLKAA